MSLWGWLWWSSWQEKLLRSLPMNGHIPEQSPLVSSPSFVTKWVAWGDFWWHIGRGVLSYIYEMMGWRWPIISFLNNCQSLSCGFFLLQLFTTLMTTMVTRMVMPIARESLRKSENSALDDIMVVLMVLMEIDGKAINKKSKSASCSWRYHGNWWWGCKLENKTWKGKAYFTSNDTVVVAVMVLMETDGKGNSHVCYPVIIQTTYIMLLAIPHHHHHHHHHQALISNWIQLFIYHCGLRPSFNILLFGWIHKRNCTNVVFGPCHI